MAIAEGDRLPATTFFTMTENGPAPVDSVAFFARRRVVLFSSPGAFTPTDTYRQLPNFITRAAEFRAKGIDEIACTAVNDAFVMGAWARLLRAEGHLTMLADSQGRFAGALGLDRDIENYALGRRGYRFSMIVADGVVEALNVDHGLRDHARSSAAFMLRQLQ